MLAVWAAAALAQVRPPLEADDKVAARDMIEAQLDAFRRDDAQGAWEHVSPGLKRQFGSAERFLEMVRTGYAPVYRPREIAFGEVGMWDGEPSWSLRVIGPDGKPYEAVYLLEEQPDGTWMTSGCLLLVADPGRPTGV